MSRPHLLLLHGALGSSEQMAPLVPREVLPLTSHPFEKVPLPRLAGSLTEFSLDGSA